MCELVVHPKQHYKRRDRYMRAVEKVRHWGREEGLLCVVDNEFLISEFDGGEYSSS